MIVSQGIPSSLVRVAAVLGLTWLAAPTIVHAAGHVAPRPAGAPARVTVSFKLDSRLSGGTYGGEHWVAPKKFTGATAQSSVEARALALDATGNSTEAALQWTAADPAMVAIKPTRGNQVTLVVKRPGESKVTVSTRDVSAELVVKARHIGGSIQMEIVQDAPPGSRAMAAPPPPQVQATMEPRPLPASRDRIVRAESSKEAGAAFLKANQQKPDVVTLPSGLQYRVVKQGDGRVPSDADIVTFRYRGTLVDGTVFATSQTLRRPARLQVARAIPGWREALKLMPVGSTWQLFVPSELAYGARGLRGKRGSLRTIGANETLVYDVELLSVETAPVPAGQTVASIPSAAPVRK